MKAIRFLSISLLLVTTLVSSTGLAKDGDAMAAPDASLVGKEETPEYLKNIKVNYWGNYSGPQIVNPTRYTTDFFGNKNKTYQNADDLLTMGYQATKGLRPGI